MNRKYVIQMHTSNNESNICLRLSHQVAHAPEEYWMKPVPTYSLSIQPSRNESIMISSLLNLHCLTVILKWNYILCQISSSHILCHNLKMKLHTFFGNAFFDTINYKIFKCFFYCTERDRGRECVYSRKRQRKFIS